MANVSPVSVAVTCSRHDRSFPRKHLTRSRGA